MKFKNIAAGIMCAAATITANAAPEYGRGTPCPPAGYEHRKDTELPSPEDRLWPSDSAFNTLLFFDVGDVKRAYGFKIRMSSLNREEGLATFDIKGPNFERLGMTIKKFSFTVLTVCSRDVKFYYQHGRDDGQLLNLTLPEKF